MKWWASLVEKYPLTHRMVMSILSIFHGPKVESSFSIMSDVIDKKANRMKDKTFSSIQTIKYALQAKHPAPCSSRAVKVYRRTDTHYTPVDSALVTNMRHAYAMSRKTRDIEMENEDKDLEVDKSNMKTKKMLVAENRELVLESQANHAQTLKKAYKPKKLADNETADNNEDVNEEENVLEEDVVKKPTVDIKKGKKRKVQVSIQFCNKKNQ